jgi:hypothetical protein
VRVDRHGFLDLSLFDDLGEVAYVAMLHVVERRAARFFRALRRAPGHDADTTAVLDLVLADEQRHIAYTGQRLAQWRREGRSLEVKEALALTRASGALDAWKRLGARTGARLGRLIMFVMYGTVVVPFAIVARLTPEATGWVAPRSSTDATRARSQY